MSKKSEKVAPTTKEKKKKSAVVIEQATEATVFPAGTEDIEDAEPAAEPAGTEFFNPDQDAFFPEDNNLKDQDIAELPEAGKEKKKRGRKKKEGGPTKPVNTVKQNAPQIPFATVVKLEANTEHEIRAFDTVTGEDRTSSIYFSVRKKAFAKGANLIRLRETWKQLSDDMLEAVKVHIANTSVEVSQEAEAAVA